MKCKQAPFKDDSGLLSKITSNIKGMMKSGRKFGLEIGMFMNDEIVENIEDIYSNIRDDSGDKNFITPSKTNERTRIRFSRLWYLHTEHGRLWRVLQFVTAW